MNRSKARTLARLSEMYGFATRATCRHRYLVEHFGQAWQRPAERGADAGCGACDVCLEELAPLEDAQGIALRTRSTDDGPVVVHLELSGIVVPDDILVEHVEAQP